MNRRSLKKHLKYMVPEIRLALIREPGKKLVSVTCPEDIEQFIEPMKYYADEHFVSFFLDAKNHVTGYQIVSHGTVSSSLVHPREVFKGAILSNAHSILVAHNHPGGSLEPSGDDIATTESLLKASDIMGVPLVDHIIVASSGHLSLRESYGYLWN